MGANQAKTPSCISQEYSEKRHKISSIEQECTDNDDSWNLSPDLCKLSLGGESETSCLVAADFKATLESHLSVKKGDRIRILSPNTSSEWLEAECLSTGQRGCIPATCLGPLPPPGPLYLGASLEMYPWFHGSVSRQNAEHLLRSGINGSYLVRDSESHSDQLSITVRYEGRVYHYRISRDNQGLFYVTEAHRFSSICQLVQHHATTPDGLVCSLLYPAPKKSRSLTTSASIQEQIDSWEIDRTEIIMRHKLGGGQYGDVYEAVWKRYNTVVAVKTVKEDVTMKVNDFLEEATVMKNLRHKNLIQLLGVCTREPPFYLVTEFMPYGNLLQYLRTKFKCDLSPSILLHMASQVTSAMAYLEKNNFIHRDLAARNCLIGEHHLVKVADFGLARYMQLDDTYTAKHGAKFPIKWTAPEGLAYNRFSCRSDVWSFGVVLWELATYGQSPYPGVELQDVYHLLENGYRMEKPAGCPDQIYNIMQRCWSWDATDRPSFQTIQKELEFLISSNSLDADVINEIDRVTTSSRNKRSQSADQGFHTRDLNSSPSASFASDKEQTPSSVANRRRASNTAANRSTARNTNMSSSTITNSARSTSRSRSGSASQYRQPPSLDETNNRGLGGGVQDESGVGDSVSNESSEMRLKQSCEPPSSSSIGNSRSATPPTSVSVNYAATKSSGSEGSLKIRFPHQSRSSKQQNGGSNLNTSSSDRDSPANLMGGGSSSKSLSASPPPLSLHPPPDQLLDEQVLCSLSSSVPPQDRVDQYLLSMQKNADDSSGDEDNKKPLINASKDCTSSNGGSQSRESTLPVDADSGKITTTGANSVDNTKLTLRPNINLDQEKESILDGVNDLILQTEFLCATYPKLTSDLEELVEQLNHLVDRNVAFLGLVGCTSQRESVINLCKLFKDEINRLAQCTGATSAADINKCLEGVQSSLSSLKTGLQALAVS